MDVTSALDITGRPGYLTQNKYASDGFRFGTREETFVAAVSALVKKAGEDVLSEVDKYARFWGISDDVAAAREKWASYLNLPEPEEKDYALRVEHNGEPIRKFAAYNGASTRKAAEAFHATRAKLPLAWRKEAAANILSRAKHFDEPLPRYLEVTLEKSACFGVPSVDGLHNALSQRWAVAPKAFHADLAKLAEFVGVIVENEEVRYKPDMVYKTAEAFDMFDKHARLTHHYHTGALDLPEDTIDQWSTLSCLEKAAAASTPDSVTLINGWECPASIDKEALAAIDPSLAKMGTAQLVDVLPTLPREDADLLQRLVS